MLRPPQLPLTHLSPRRGPVQLCRAGVMAESQALECEDQPVSISPSERGSSVQAP